MDSSREEPVVVLSPAGGGRAEVHLHGGHVARWADASGDEVLYLSPRSRFGGSDAIRGGIPVIFPQFADLGPLPRHGFARTAEWTLAGRAADRAVLRLADDAATRAVWDHAFELELRVEAGDALAVTLAVRNTGERTFAFTGALHTYLRVGDVRRAAVLGLDGVGFHDKVRGGDWIETGQDLRFAGETDRVYRRAPDELRVRDEAEGRTIVLRKRGFEDAVVWNPWAEKAREMADLGEDQFPRFVCLEAAQVGAPVTLEPGEHWEAGQEIRVVR
jgi:glucose-6-phosphate 1-epimerase